MTVGLAMKVLPFVGQALIRLIHLTCRVRFELPDTLPAGPMIVAFWHGNLLMQPYLYKKIRGAHPIAVMISEHKDGEMIASVIRYFGFDTVRGSSRKGAARVLLSAMKKIDEGYDLAITPDGPKGPRFSIADGIVAVAQKKEIPIVPFCVTASRYWEFSSWDRFMVPKPFSTLTLRAGTPFVLGGMEMEEARRKVGREMGCGA